MTDEPRRGRCPAPVHLGAIGAMFDDCPTCNNRGTLDFRPWSKDDEAALIRLWARGMNLAFIGIELRRSVPDLLEHAAILKLEERHGPTGYILHIGPMAPNPLFGTRADAEEMNR